MIDDAAGAAVAAAECLGVGAEDILVAGPHKNQQTRKKSGKKRSFSHDSDDGIDPLLHKSQQTRKKSGKKRSFSHDSDDGIDPLLRKSPHELLLKSPPETLPPLFNSSVGAVTERVANRATATNFDSNNDSGEVEFDCLTVVGKVLVQVAAVASLGVCEEVAVSPSLYIYYLESLIVLTFVFSLVF